MKKIMRRHNPQQIIADALHPLLQRVYGVRGINSLAELERGLEALISYHELKGMSEMIAYLVAALKEQKHILIVGDFDADGATSTALALKSLQAFGFTKVSYLVPNRFTYGYGLTEEIVKVAVNKNPQVIITVDNGISSHAGVKAAQALGIQVLITDHHLPSSELPPAEAIVNPNQWADFFPSKCLAGVGVIFYVMLALRASLRQQQWFLKNAIPEPNMAQFLDLVALGTVADLVPLDKNNRILVHQGLQRIRAGHVCPGILALLEAAGRDFHNITASDLGFAVGPRLNAAGRLEDMSLGIECLISTEPQAAKAMALELDNLNQNRQHIELTMQQQAERILQGLQLQQGKLPYGLCLFDETWHQGVVGLIASRIKEKTNRPVIAFAPANDMELKGSARSIDGLHIRDTLDTMAARFPGLISKFGGHAMAAGICLKRADYDKFCQVFIDELGRALKDDDLKGYIYSDGELTDYSLDIAELLREAGPWGQGFPEPLFDGLFAIVEQRLVGEGGKHLKLLLQSHDDKKLIDAIAFNVNNHAWPNHRCQKIHAAYRLAINEFRGLRRVQLIIEHMEPIGVF